MTARANLRALAVASVVAAACSDSVEPPLQAFAVSPAAQWSGGAITVRSSFFVGRDPLPVLTAAADTLPVSRQDDSTVVATLARGPSGLVTIYLARGTRRDSVASLQRVGFREKRTVTPALYGELLATDSARNPVVLGASFTGSQDRQPVVRLKVVPGLSQVLTLRQPSIDVYGMAPTITAGVYAVRDATDSLRLAALLVDAPVVTGTVPWIGTDFARQTSLIGSGLWLFTQSHWTAVRTEADSSEVTRVATESPWAVYISPRGDRTTLATVVGPTTGNGVPVFDNATGSVAFVMPLLSTEAATFSFDGATLYVAGGNQGSSDTLLALDATNGVVVAPKVALPVGFEVMGLAYRADGGGQLLVGAAQVAGTVSTLALLVYRASTLELLGVLPTPDNCGLNPKTGPCFMGVVTLSEAHAAAYIVIPGSPTPIWTFDLVSTP